MFITEPGILLQGAGIRPRHIRHPIVLCDRRFELRGIQRLHRPALHPQDDHFLEVCPFHYSVSNPSDSIFSVAIALVVQVCYLFVLSGESGGTHAPLTGLSASSPTGSASCLSDGSRRSSVGS